VRTAVFIFSDHGFSLGEFNLWAKHRVLQRDAHVPLIVHAPGQAEGQRYDGPVELLDVVPTALSMLGIPWTSCRPGDVNSKDCAEGRSILPLPMEHKTARSQFQHDLWWNGTQTQYMGYTLFTPDRLRFTAWVHFDRTSASTAWELYGTQCEGLELYNHSRG
jgi:iduronate 2-sulfatase